MANFIYVIYLQRHSSLGRARVFALWPKARVVAVFNRREEFFITFVSRGNAFYLGY